jgi:hypothetical protein
MLIGIDTHKISPFSEETTPGPQDYDPQAVATTSPSYTIRPRVGEPVFTNKEDGKGNKTK